MDIPISVGTFEPIAASVLEAIRPITEWGCQGTPQYYADGIPFSAYGSGLDDAGLSTGADPLAIYFDTAGVKGSVVGRVYSAIVDGFPRRGTRLARSGDIDGGSQGLVYDASLMAARKVPETAGGPVSRVQADYRLPDKPAAVKKAAGLMEVKGITVWQWIKGARQVSPPMPLPMGFTASAYAPVERPGISGWNGNNPAALISGAAD